VIDQIGGFIGQLMAIVNRGRQGGFNAFLSYFLRDALGAAGVEPGGVGAFRIGALT